MSEDEAIDVTPKDALQVAQRALAKVNEQQRRADDLEERLDDAETELTRLALRISEFDDDRGYDQLTRDDKVGLVREYGFKKATAGRGVARLEYSDIEWGVFDGEPSADHCYKLMRLAADLPGFEYRDPASGNRHLHVDAETARTLARGFSSANKAEAEGEPR